MTRDTVQASAYQTAGSGPNGLKPDLIYLTEGGQETEIMFRHGFDLPEFAMFPLLDDPLAVERLRDMYTRYFETAAQHGCGALVGGLDYRASPDWAGKLGYDSAALQSMQLRCIEFLREIAAPFQGRIPSILFTGIIGPRGDAYALQRTITAAEAETYHSVQMTSLRRANVDVVTAMTFNNVPEAIGIARAAAGAGLPLILSFTLDSTCRLKSGDSLRQAIEAVDLATGEARPAFYGINCSHPLEFEPAIDDGKWFQRVRMLRPNAVMMEKVALCKLGHLESGDPQDLGRRMGELARRFPHINVWGGCCGTWDEHLHEIAGQVLVRKGADRKDD